MADSVIFQNYTHILPGETRDVSGLGSVVFTLDESVIEPQTSVLGGEIPPRVPTGIGLDGFDEDDSGMATDTEMLRAFHNFDPADLPGLDAILEQYVFSDSDPIPGFDLNAARKDFMKEARRRGVIEGGRLDGLKRTVGSVFHRKEA